jgi:hypothetical protein
MLKYIFVTHKFYIAKNVSHLSPSGPNVPTLLLSE